VKLIEKKRKNNAKGIRINEEKTKEYEMMKRKLEREKKNESEKIEFSRENAAENPSRRIPD
jgi:uncharacterized protein YdaU (DUF1376 family)